jgi:D-glycero-alpha-D-manno-heptose 1-phosphate guanylyltransferase
MADRISGAILAAGHGQRLRQASGGLPKPLVDLGGQPLLFRQIFILFETGANPVHVIVNSETHGLMRQRRLHLPDKVKLLVLDTPNSMESLLKLGECITSEAFLLMTVDAVISICDVKSFVTDATKIIGNAGTDLGGVLGVVRWRGDANPLFVEIVDDTAIKSLGQRDSPMVTAGIYLLSTSVFALAAEARERALGAMRQFLSLVLEKGMRFAALEVPQAIDIDDRADLGAAREMIARQSK